MGFSERRRGWLLPAVLVAGAVLLGGRAFVPPPVRPPQTNGALEAATAATLMAMATGAAPAGAIDNPLAHGIEGDFESDMLQGIMEKCAFGGLLVSTAAAWWRGTLGSAQASSQELGGRPPSFWALGAACFSIVVLLSDRWYQSGHFPLSNMYESLMFLAWGVTAVTLYFAVSEQRSAEEQKQLGLSKAPTTDIAAVWASPVALGIVAFATLKLPKALQKASALVPALQSNWLVMHVSVVMCSYATLLFGSVLCMAVLALSQPKDSPITALKEAVVPAFRGIANSLAPPQPVVATSPQVPTSEPLAAMATDMEAQNIMSAGSQMKVVTSSGGAVTVEFAQSSTGAARLSEDDQLSLTLEDLAYRSLLLGFGFLTIGIVSGAVWANEAWGSYWSWDPKETWALITWLVYALYLHTRLQLGWDTRDSAKIGAFGFFVVWLCYVGVNLMGVGLHSYGFFLK